MAENIEMTANQNAPVELAEDRVPFAAIETTIAELVELYGGEMESAAAPFARQFVLPLRRGMAAAGGVHCTLTWAADDAVEATVRIICDRNVDAPKAQRVAFLGAGVVGALLFTVWPFFPNMGAVAWVGGAIAIAAYFMASRKTGNGLAADFLQRLARRQRALAEQH